MLLKLQIWTLIFYKEQTGKCIVELYGVNFAFNSLVGINFIYFLLLLLFLLLSHVQLFFFLFFY